MRNTARGLAGFAATPYRYLLPRPIDRRFLSGLVDAGLPAGTVTVRLQRLDQLTRQIPTFAAAEGLRRPRTVGNALTSYVIRHRQATIIVDPAICHLCEQRVMPELPWILRSVVRPPADVTTVVEAMERGGLAPEEIDFALPTHLHWDHVCGLLDLPGLPVVVHTREHDWILSGKHPPVGGVRSALSGRRVDRYVLEGPPVLTFERSHDVFGDGSVVLVHLAGHTPGSVGILLRTEDGPVLLAGDAVWHNIQIDRLRQKAPFPGFIVDVQRTQTFRTLHRLHAIRNKVRIIPAHNPES